MISIGYVPETGHEHLVMAADRHPGAHLPWHACPCGPTWDDRALAWVHSRPVPGPTAQQRALVLLAVANCDLRDALRESEAEHAREREHFERVRRLMSANLGARPPRPYEGSLAREIAHALVRWRAYRR